VPGYHLLCVRPFGPDGSGAGQNDSDDDISKSDSNSGGNSGSDSGDSSRLSFLTLGLREGVDPTGLHVLDPTRTPVFIDKGRQQQHKRGSKRSKSGGSGDDGGSGGVGSDAPELDRDATFRRHVERLLQLQRTDTAVAASREVNPRQAPQVSGRSGRLSGACTCARMAVGCGRAWGGRSSCVGGRLCGWSSRVRVSVVVVVVVIACVLVPW
jgi:hypothetical protein